jgi:hypothetical protein
MVVFVYQIISNVNIYFEQLSPSSIRVESIKKNWQQDKNLGETKQLVRVESNSQYQWWTKSTTT